MTETTAAGARSRAVELVDSLAIELPAQLDIELIAAHCGAFVDYRPLGNQEGHIVRSGAVAHIVVDDAARSMSHKWRFVIAHELGHFLLHPELDQFKMCTSSELGSWYQGGGFEYTANVFAAELLMPTRLFSPFCAAPRPTLDEVADVATRFSTSLTSTALRFVQLSSQPCAAVYSRDGRVGWAATSKTFQLHVERGRELSGTAAADLADGATGLDAPMSVAGARWSADDSAAETELVEHSRVLGSYGVLSLLWHEPAKES